MSKFYLFIYLFILYSFFCYFSILKWLFKIPFFLKKINFHNIFFKNNSSKLYGWYCLILIDFVWDILHLSLYTNFISW